MSVEGKTDRNRQDRRKRIQMLKRIILSVIGASIVIPWLLCIAFFTKTRELRAEINLLSAANEKLSLQEERPVEKVEEEISNTVEAETETQIQKANPSYPGKREVYFTFDDGPSGNTDAILDILKEHQVKATFFVIGKTDEASKRLYRRIVEEGHTIGLHSYTHKYREIYASKEAYIEDLTKLQEYIYEVTGTKTYFVRFPGGSSNQVSHVDMKELITYLQDNGFIYFDWNISSGDANSARMPVDRLVNNCMNKLEELNDEAVILMHDASEKKTTVQALSRTLDRIQQMEDTQILPITEDTVPIQHVTVTK